MTAENPSVLSIWAHYDDDLIFGNPTIDAAIGRGEPVTSVFLTGSDAGRGMQYAADREHGLRLAYEHMRGDALTWDEGRSELGGAAITTWTAREAPVVLASLGLPDGRPNGAGFEQTGNQSLRQVLEGTTDAISPLDGGEPLTRAGLVAFLGELLARHRGATVLAHAPASAGPWAREDHSDHWSTGEFVREALVPAGGSDADVSWRVGYPSARLAANLAGEELERKVDVFRTYANHDPVVARDDVAGTLALRGFGDWLRRSYAIVPGDADPSAL